MRSDVAWAPLAALGVTLLWTGAGLINALGPAPPARRVQLRAPELTLHRPRIERAAVTAAPAPPTVDFEREVARLAARPPIYREPLHEAYVKADDLYRFMRELLSDAEAGERAAQFYLYLTISRCQMYLRLDEAEADAVAARMMLLVDDRPVDERLQWQNEHRRCYGFAGADLTALRAAMGTDLPGSENEYASIWYQRAADSGHPLALAEGALRISTLTLRERVAMLEEALAGGDAEVYWMLFHHSPGATSAAVSTAGVAWLLLACRAGHDCTRGAEWFRQGVCLLDGERCAPGESALEHFWSGLPAPDREAAWRLAERIEADRLAGRYDDMPWPELGRRNLLETRVAEE